MILMIEKLKNICKRHKLNYDQAVRIIVEHHVIERMHKKSELVEVENVELNEAALRIISKWAKALRVDRNSVIAALLRDRADELERQRERERLQEALDSREEVSE